MKKIALISTIILLTACQEYGGPLNRSEVGALLGGATGAIAGSQIGGGSGRGAAIAVGTIVGVMVGSDIGLQLNKADRNYYAHATHNALENQPTGKTVTWRNPDSGNYGSTTVKKTRPVKLRDGAKSYCREYQTTITVAGDTQQGYGTACRQTDGTWKIIS